MFANFEKALDRIWNVEDAGQKGLFAATIVFLGAEYVQVICRECRKEPVKDSLS